MNNWPLDKTNKGLTVKSKIAEIVIYVDIRHYRIRYSEYQRPIKYSNVHMQLKYLKHLMMDLFFDNGPNGQKACYCILQMKNTNFFGDVSPLGMALASTFHW